MMFAISALEGCTVEASDGEVGTVKDILFDDEAWRIRWVVVDTGTWLTGRKVFLDLKVASKRGWQKNPGMMKELGYVLPKS